MAQFYVCVHSLISVSLHRIKHYFNTHMHKNTLISRVMTFSCWPLCTLTLRFTVSLVGLPTLLSGCQERQCGKQPRTDPKRGAPCAIRYLDFVDERYLVKIYLSILHDPVLYLLFYIFLYRIMLYDNDVILKIFHGANTITIFGEVVDHSGNKMNEI